MKLWFERGAWASSRGRRIATEMRPEDVKRIAVIRHAALGDMVLVRPFLVEARKFFPNAEIVLSLVSNYTYGAPTDLVDSVHVLHGSDKNRVSLKERIARARELGPVDILFDLADTTRSRYLCLLTKAKLKIGFPYRWYLRNLLFHVAVFRSDFLFEAEVMLDTLRVLGSKPVFPLDFHWPGGQPRLAWATTREQRIVYFPFASVDSKCWPRERFVDLILKLSQEFPEHSHVVLGGVGEQESPQKYLALAKQRSNVLLQPAMPLESTVNFLSTSCLVISNDTGIRNLAIAAYTPTLGIFFSTVPYRYCPRAQEKHEIIFSSDGQLPSVEEVFSGAWQLLARDLDKKDPSECSKKTLSAIPEQ
jgi:ADP-heptose:LPS heptosyltransferase